MSGYRNRTLQRVDTTAKALILEAQEFGARYLPINGVVDGVLFYRTRVFVVDWKGEKTSLTKTQQKHVDAGFPIWFIRTSDELRQMLEIK